MKILVIDVGSNALDWLMRCQLAGHEVMWFDRNHDNGDKRLSGQGIVPKCYSIEEVRKKWLGWADLIFTPDNILYVSMLEPYRKLGYPIFGCNLAASKWELDRGVGQEIFKKCGIPVIEGKTFYDYDKAIAYVEKMGVAMVSKPCGDADKALSYVSNNAADLVYMMEKWKKNPKYKSEARKLGFVVQEKKIGCEMAIGGWFGPGGWSKWWCENFEYKKLMADDKGVNTGESGTIVRYVKQSKLADIVLKPATEELHKIDYVGYVDVNCIIDEQGTPWPMEWTMRNGWPITHNQNALHLGDPAQWMLDLINGFDTLKVSTDVCASVVVTLPPYPYPVNAKDVSGIPIYNATDMNHIHLSEVKMGIAPVMVGDKVMRIPNYVTAGPYVLVATGTGETITGARRSVYAAVDKVKIPNDPQYRPDIGKGKLVENLPKIQKQGYAKGLSY